MKNDKGFTLIEMIASLVLAGILTAIAGTGLVQISKSFIFTKQNMDTVQNGQLGMLRTLKEFTNISSITASSNTSITFVSEHAAPITYTLSWSGTNNDPLVLTTGGTGYDLTDSVNNFNLLYYDTYNAASANTWTNGSSTIIQVILSLNGAEGVISTFTTRVEPRNL